VTLPVGDPPAELPVTVTASVLLDPSVRGDDAGELAVVDDALVTSTHSFVVEVSVLPW
jgi:hypothetical protein